MPRAPASGPSPGPALIPAPGPALAPSSAGRAPRSFALDEGPLLAVVRIAAPHHPALRWLATGARAGQAEIRMCRATDDGWVIRATVRDEGEIAPGVHAGASVSSWLLSGAAAPGDPAAAEGVQAEWGAFLARPRAWPCIARCAAFVEE